MWTQLLKDAWTLAIEALSWIELQNLSERLALSKTDKQLNITDTGAKGLAYRLVYETMRSKNLLDSLINQALKPHTINDYELGVRAFLRLYVYKTRIEHKGDVHKEAIEIARMGRSILRWQTLQPVEKALGALLSLRLGKISENLSDVEKVALKTNNPAWFVEYCSRLLGRREALEFLASSQDSLPTYIQVNTLKAPEEETIQVLQNEGVHVEKVPELRHVYRFDETSRRLASIRGFEEGLFYVQDKASCLAVEVAAPASGMVVFDVCAAPGAKTTSLAMLMQNKGAIYSFDYSRRRMIAWKHNVARRGVKNALPLIADVRRSLPLNKAADVVILDPSCTNTGVFARTPSAKWRLTPQSMAKMAGIQWQMLRGCAEKVRENGWLVYCTCSISVEENEMQVERFLRLYPEFKLAETKPWVGLPGLRGLVKCQRLYPHIHKCNGFFIAKLQKEA
jgi:16S rRNA (cytosine967-C5)-methyltransferase